MPDHPIIFSAPMIRALLDGRKTQTRRLAWASAPKRPGPRVSHDNGKTWVVPSLWQRVQPGDRLWVREAWKDIGGGTAWYRADRCRGGETGWRPSIHMPRWASRLTLHVEAVRVERLQDISEEDAGAEGVTDFALLQSATSEDMAEAQTRLRWRQREFFLLWDRLHGRDAAEANPEVVVLTFRVERRNIDA